jgi:hypothetical protein
MTLPELATALRDAVNGASEGEVVVSIHLFGIKHERDLRNVPLKALVSAARIHASYVTEIRKGMNLAQYVTLR